jgi:hypothetical protein
MPTIEDITPRGEGTPFNPTYLGWQATNEAARTNWNSTTASMTSNGLWMINFQALAALHYFHCKQHGDVIHPPAAACRPWLANNDTRRRE